MICLILVLGTVGVLFIYSAFSTEHSAFLENPMVVKQIIFILIGITLVAIFSHIDYSLYRRMAVFVYLFSILLLLGTAYVFPTVKGRWIRIGFLSVQPSEFAKIAFIIYISNLFRNYFMDRSKGYIINLTLFILKTGMVTLIPFYLVFSQPDLGTAMVFPGIWLVLMIFLGTGQRLIGGLLLFLLSSAGGMFLRIAMEGSISGIWGNIFLGSGLWTVLLFVFASILLTMFLFLLMRFLTGSTLSVLTVWIMFILFFSGIYISGAVVSVIKPYQKNRIRTFIDPYSDIRGSGWNVIQSKISIGSGGFSGKGLTKGTQNRLNFLPERHTDFIFSLISEEWGFRGSFFVLLLQGIILFFISITALRATDVYGFYLSLSIFLVLLFHAFMNVGMNMGILPVTGIPLPFVSYGGSFFISWCILIGINLNIHSQGATIKSVGAYWK